MIFVLLFSIFRSAKYALLVFSGVPLGLTGGIVALWLRGMPFSISAAVGFIALSGVAVLNGLVMVMRSSTSCARKASPATPRCRERGCLMRLRPGADHRAGRLARLRADLSTGNGAEVQRPLATVVIGGIISSTLLTLVVLPALYRLWHRKKKNSPP